MKLLLLALCCSLVACATALDQLDTPGPGGMDCSLKMDKKDCWNGKGCMWCEGMLGASCFSKDQAKFLPSAMFKCKAAKKAAVEAGSDAGANPGPGPGPTPGPGPMCSGATDKKECKKTKGCVWCVGSFGPTPMGTCYDEAQAKWLPAQFYKCSKPSKHSNAIAAA